ncbi:MAG: hypothetical protein KGL96_10605 [Hyphomicrobiales bacterium]|nr:hypothetical protein [Hyphomicrobiales bacterium]
MQILNMERLVTRLELLNRIMVRGDILLEAYRNYIAELFVAGMDANSEIRMLYRLSEIQQARNLERARLEREIMNAGLPDGQPVPESTT